MPVRAIMKMENEKTISQEFTPEEVALLTRLKIFINLRWTVIAGTIIATFVGPQVFHIIFPTLPVYIICAIIAAYNVVLFFQIRNLTKVGNKSLVETARGIGNIHFFLDLMSLAGILHFTGGIENPFIFYFVAHVVSASVVVHYRVAFFLSTTAIIIVVALVGLEYFGVIPHENLQGFASPNLYQEPVYIFAVLIVLITLIYGFTYMLTAVSGELRKRQRQVLKLQEWLLEQKNYELGRASREIYQLGEERKRFLFFLGVAAHDLKAPLTAIQSYLWVMLDGYAGKLTEKQHGMLERCSFRIRELLNLISNLLDIPRIETGQLVHEMKEISLLEIVNKSIEGLRNLAEEKKLRIIPELPDKLPNVNGAESRLAQVINNLLDNAIRYTPQGSITVRAKQNDKYIEVQIEDTGIGIPQQDLPKICQDFFRASNVDTKGTGLGLSIVKRIIEAHGGKIWVESPVPESKIGTRVAFMLPVAC
ncbi:MAG: hypothetical protein A2Z02_05310 [Chloroflexi bacterium RBG_16_48_7]|nr:MAG: hypothetical protein A2Z02_05310 [Chloroflexi bacterium RBG_16_48_7]